MRRQLQCEIVRRVAMGALLAMLSTVIMVAPAHGQDAPKQRDLPQGGRYVRKIGDGVRCYDVIQDGFARTFNVDDGVVSDDCAVDVKERVEGGQVVAHDETSLFRCANRFGSGAIGKFAANKITVTGSTRYSVPSLDTFFKKPWVLKRDTKGLCP